MFIGKTITNVMRKPFASCVLVTDGFEVLLTLWAASMARAGLGYKPCPVCAPSAMVGCGRLCKAWRRAEGVSALDLFKVTLMLLDKAAES